MGWLDNLGINSVDEAAGKLAPLLDNAENRLRQIAWESIERLNGATLDLEFIEGKTRITVKLPPVSPPAVRNR